MPSFKSYLPFKYTSNSININFFIIEIALVYNYKLFIYLLLLNLKKNLSHYIKPFPTFSYIKVITQQ